MNYINIHSHEADINNICIQNLNKNFELTAQTGYYSVGLHPWYINPYEWKTDFENLKKTLLLSSVVAIGECGLDRFCKTDFSLQQQVFEAHVHLANETKKPLILHVDRAHEDVLQLLKKLNNTSPFIFHGFNKNKVLAEKLMDAGAYLSFGKGVNLSHVADILKNIDADRFFMETDDAVVSIESIYKATAAIRNISVEALSLQLQKNTKHIFKIPE
jgi:TatD DNase family protein